jgi:hypothetical protein
VIKRNFGLLACTSVATYLLLSPIYALLNFQEYASDVPQLMRYVLIPGLIGAAFLATGLLARPRIATAAGTYALSALLALFTFEAVLTVYSIPVRLGMLGQLTAEQRERLERDENMVRGFTLGRLNHLSGTRYLSNALLSGFPGMQVILCSSNDNLITYTADRYGFNNPDQIYSHTLDIILLGDSFIEGFCLRRGDDLASRLRSGGRAAASLGIRGNGPLIALASLGRFGQIFRPRNVVMAFFEGNDWENLENELTQPWLRAALAANADFGSPSSASGTLQRAKAVMIEEINNDRVTMTDLFTKTAVFRNFVALQQTFTKLGLVYPKVAQPIPEFSEALRRAKALSEGWGGTFTIVYVPRVDRFMGGVFSPDLAYDRLRTIVLDAAAAEGIDVIDLYSAMRELPDPERMYAPDNHFSRDGAAFAAEVIIQRLAKNNQALAGEPNHQLN